MRYSTHGLAVGEEEAVGVRYFEGTEKHPPLRIFYPAAVSERKPRPVGWFHEGGVGNFISGYIHLALIISHTCTFRWIVSPVVHILSLFLPLRWIKIPEVSLEAPLALMNGNARRRPVVLFSHGLTGTGQENALLHTCWAKRGFVVVSIHHRDGSSCRVPNSDGSILWYDKGPPFSNYDPTFRPRQVQQRASEMMDAFRFLSSVECPKQLRDGVDTNKVIAAGYSFGAATAALAAVQEQERFAGVVLLDGWFYIDVSESAGVEFEFPEQAFGSGIHKPMLFVNSQAFREMPKLWAATKKLANSSNAPEETEMHVVPQTNHQNFTDAIFWLPKALVRKMAGPAMPVDAYREIVNLTSSFMLKIVGDSLDGQ